MTNTASRLLRALAVFTATFVVLFGVLYLHFGTEWGWSYIPGWALIPLVVGLLVLLFFQNNRGQHRVVAAVLLVAGVFLLMMSVYGLDGVFCNAGVYPPNAPHGFVYDWTNNVLAFGDTDGESYRCGVRPFRGGLVLGYGAVNGAVLLERRGQSSS